METMLSLRNYARQIGSTLQETFLAVLFLSTLACAQLVNGPRGFPVPNDGVTGTTLNGTATINSAGQAIAATTGNTTVPTYIVIVGAGLTGYAGLASTGVANCTMDSTIASAAGGYFVVNSPTVAKQCHAQAAAPAGGTWVIGSLVVSSTVAGSSALVAVGGYAFGGVGGGVGDPGSNGIMKRTALNVTAPTVASDVVGLFGSCSGTQYLGADGACHNAGSGGGFSYNACAIGLACNGSTNDTAALTTLLGTIGSAAAELYLTGTTLLSTISIPPNVALDFTPGGAVKVATGQTVTIQGPIVAPPRQIFFNVGAGQGATSFAGNHTLSRISPLWWGLDCTGATDNAPVWTQIVAFTGDNSTFIVPNNCIDQHASTVTVPSRSGFRLLSEARAQNGGGNVQRPMELWTGPNDGTGMWDFQANQAATIEGFFFYNNDGTTSRNVGYYIRLDHDPVTYINTEGLIRYNTFTSATSNANFVAVYLSQVSAQNGEKHVVTDNDFFCSQTHIFRENDNGVVTSGSNVLTDATGSFTTDANVGDRVRVTSATGNVDTTIQSITNNTTLVMNANAGSNQTGARVMFRGALGSGIQVGQVNAKHHTFDRNSFTQCASGLNIRNGSFSASHLGGSMNDALVTILDISEASEVSYAEDESAYRDIETINNLDSVLTLSHLRLSYSNQASWSGMVWFGAQAHVVIRDSITQLGPGANAVTIGKGALGVNITSIGNLWSQTMAQIGYAQWRVDTEGNNILAQYLLSCGDTITDAPGTCFQFGETSATPDGTPEGHLVVSQIRSNNSPSYSTYTAETATGTTSFVNEAVGYKSNICNAVASNFCPLGTGGKFIGFDVGILNPIRGGNFVGFRTPLPVVNTTTMTFARGLWIAAPTANTLITEADGVYVEDLATHTGIANRYSFKAVGATDTMLSLGLVDFTSSAIFRARVGSGLTTSVFGDIGYDTTNKNWHAWQNGTDSYVFTGPVSGTYTNGDCVKFGVASSVLTLVDNGSGCASNSVGVLDLTAQAANVSATTVYAVPVSKSGTYLVSCYVVLTQVATTSSTLPQCNVKWTDSDSGVTTPGSQVTSSGISGNTLGLTGASGGWLGVQSVQAAASTNIQILTTGYASSGGTPMQYAVHAKVQFLGP